MARQQIWSSPISDRSTPTLLYDVEAENWGTALTKFIQEKTVPGVSYYEFNEAAGLHMWMGSPLWPSEQEAQAFWGPAPVIEPVMQMDEHETGHDHHS